MTLAVFVFFTLSIGAGRIYPATNSFTSLHDEFTQTVRPTLKEYCFGCHSAEKHKGDLNLERFVTVNEIRRETKVWEKALEMLHTGEMPPKEKPQPSVAERERLERWVGALLDAEARASAGDPGRVVMRRLSNVEYTRTVCDLTRVSLDPAKEFPIDGAAGEGFVNVGEALVMSPSLLDKYLDAAKGIARHAVLLPEGFRFASGVGKGDWIDELLRSIRQFYADYTQAEGGQQINLQGIVFDTNTGGRLPIEKYLEATLAERDAFRLQTKTFEAVALERGLNAKYLASLWQLLNGRGDSPILEILRGRWRNAAVTDAIALAAEIARWQQALTRFQTVGHMKPWMVGVDPLVSKQNVRLKIAAPTNSEEITLYLVTSDAGDGNSQDYVVWDRPRLVIPGQADLLLRDLREVTRQMSGRRSRLFAAAAKCLTAAAEASAAHQPLDREALARRHGVEPEELSAWFDYLGIGSKAVLQLDHFTNRLAGVGNYDFVQGWGAQDTPNLVANASTQFVRIPGNLKSHGVAVHPSPKLNAAVGWLSPIAGAVRVEAAVTHAHPECGNGVTWSVELRRGATRQRLATGTAQGSKTVKVGPLENVAVVEGDLISLLIGPRDGNHSCDLTDIELTLADVGQGGFEWNLTQDVATSIMAANPHPDRSGREGIWHFYTEPVSAASGVGPVIPTGSLLARWQSATSQEERQDLANAIEKLLRIGPSTNNSPDAALYRQLASLGGPLLSGSRGKTNRLEAASAKATPGPDADSQWGLDPASFGRHPNGASVDEFSLCTQAPSMVEIRLPADLVVGCEFVTTGFLHAETGGEGSVQLQVLTRKPEDQSPLLPSNLKLANEGKGPWGSDTSEITHATPILAQEGSLAEKRFKAGFEEFRKWFPAALCYTKIVPVDEVITITVFHREDEPLCRLMLSDAEKAKLDRLWDELRFIGQDALTIVDAYAQLMEYATQDSNPKLFEHLRQPILDRAASFRQLLASSEPRQLDALMEFAGRAYRRPLSEIENEKLRALYRELRETDLSHDDAFRLTLARVLVSPSFLYRVEHPAPGDKPQPVSDWELASRLSYFLWSSMPDEPLREAARSGRLHEAETLKAESQRLLKDPRARSLAIEFACQWLHIRDFDILDEKSERHFPTFAGLRGDIYEEAVRYFLDLFQRDGSVLEILNSDHTFLNETLARHYEIPGVTGPEWRRVEGVRKYGRGGVLGLASVLAKQSGASRTSPILRGNWVVETLLGEKLPKPPPNVPVLPESETDTGGLTMRQITEKHTSVPECIVCHQRIDPFGYSLEQYDAIGRRREKDLAEREIDARAQLKWKDDVILDGMNGLRDYLLTKRRDDFIRTFCRKFLGYSLGRGLKLSDLPLVEEMQSQLRQNGYRFSAALETILRSQQFRDQRGLEATKEDEI